MAKLTKKLIEEIALFIEQDSYTISEVCTMFGISRKTFYQWKDSKPEFAEAIEVAMDNRNSKLVALARRGLRDRLQGYTVYTEKVILAPDPEAEDGYKVVKKECVSREYGPDLKAIQYILDKEDKRMAEAEAKTAEDNVAVASLAELSEEERNQLALYEKYGDIMKIEDPTARHHLMYLRDKMRDGTHPQLTGEPMSHDWEGEYIACEDQSTVK